MAWDKIIIYVDTDIKRTTVTSKKGQKGQSQQEFGCLLWLISIIWQRWWTGIASWTESELAYSLNYIKCMIRVLWRAQSVIKIRAVLLIFPQLLFSLINQFFHSEGVGWVGRVWAENIFLKLLRMWLVNGYCWKSQLKDLINKQGPQSQFILLTDRKKYTKIWLKFYYTSLLL